MIEGIPVADLGPPALLGIFFLLFFLGRIVPRRTLDDQIAEKNEWRSAHRISEQARAELSAQVNELLEHARTTDAFIRALPQAAANRDVSS